MASVYKVVLALFLAVFATFSYADIFPQPTQPTGVIATCNVITINFLADSLGEARIYFDGKLVKKDLRFFPGGNAFQLYISPKTKLGPRLLTISDPVTGTSVTYPFTVVNGCKNRCSSSYDSSCSSSSSSSSSCSSSSSSSSSDSSSCDFSRRR